MGLLRALRRYAPHAEASWHDMYYREATGYWQPPTQYDAPVVAAGSAMDDDGCAGEHAYGVSFTRPGMRSTVTVWCYPSYAGPDPDRDGYIVGYRVEYRSGDWSSADYTSDALYNGGVHLDVAYLDLEIADVAAREKADRMMQDDAILPLPECLPECLREYFDWDGAPW